MEISSAAKYLSYRMHTVGVGDMDKIYGRLYVISDFMLLYQYHMISIVHCLYMI